MERPFLSFAFSGLLLMLSACGQRGLKPEISEVKCRAVSLDDALKSYSGEQIVKDIAERLRSNPGSRLVEVTFKAAYSGTPSWAANYTKDGLFLYVAKWDGENAALPVGTLTNVATKLDKYGMRTSASYRDLFMIPKTTRDFELVVGETPIAKIKAP